MRRKKVTARIGRPLHRTLPEFEEHEIGFGFVPSGAYQEGYWRAVTVYSDDPKQRIRRFYNCADCGHRHDLPFPKCALVCPHLPDAEARTRAIGRIEGKIAQARGQPPQVADAVLEDLAAEIVFWSERYPWWGRKILDEYRQHPRLNSYIRAIEDVPLPAGDNVRPPPELAEMIWKHLPLVRSLAKRRAGKTCDVTGRRATDDALYSMLEEIGVRALEQAARRFDPTRGVTFGAFAKKGVDGAMVNYLKRERILTVGGDGYDMALNGRDLADDTPPGGERRSIDRRTLKATKRHRSSTGGYKETAYISTSAPPVRCPDGSPTTRLIRRTVNEALEAALEKLNHRQQVVYRGRVLSDPPVPRAVLGAQLGVDERQIPRIMKQAEAKMRRFLKVSPPPEIV
jgi:RNA polymerase sigma factor (sigma-70 family)